MKFKAQILDEVAVKKAMARISYEVIERMDTTLFRSLLAGARGSGF